MKVKAVRETEGESYRENRRKRKLLQIKHCEEMKSEKLLDNKTGTIYKQ